MIFEDLELNPELLRALAECGYRAPTPIQAQVIPHILMMRDVVGLAQTGTGKTAGFILPMIQILSDGRAKARMPRSLVLAPTRELAAQVAENFQTYGKYTRLSMALLVGGEAMGDQTRLLDRGVDVLIATPGRFLDLLERGAVLLSDIRILVIDEADRMLDMGFIPDIEKIVSRLPAMRQTLLFSATMPPEIRKLTERFLSNPRHVAASPQTSVADTVAQFLIQAPHARAKKKILLGLVRDEALKNAFIFLNRKRDVDHLAQWLQKEGFDSAPLHGDMVQNARTKTLQAFREGRLKFLVCSDIAARGLDIDAVSHVFNYDVPINAEDYVHRIGRTGRAGLSGQAWTIASPEDQKQIQAIEALIQKPIPVYVPPDLDTEQSHTTQTPQKQIQSTKPTRQGKSSKTKESPSVRVEREESDEEQTGFGSDIPAFFRIGR